MGACSTTLLGLSQTFNLITIVTTGSPFAVTVSWQGRKVRRGMPREEMFGGGTVIVGTGEHVRVRLFKEMSEGT